MRPLVVLVTLLQELSLSEAFEQESQAGVTRLGGDRWAERREAGRHGEHTLGRRP